MYEWEKTDILLSRSNSLIIAYQRVNGEKPNESICEALFERAQREVAREIAHIEAREAK